jgi:endonuclease YncB( thermonuclease family)
MRFIDWRSMVLALALLGSESVPAHPGSVDAQGCHRESKSQQRHCHPERVRKARPVYGDSHLPRAGDEGVFLGPLVSVTDGDTLWVRIQGVAMEIRLSAVDAPESDQPYGSRATAELRSLVKGRQLVLVFVDVDRYGRIVADVWADEISINQEMVKRGAAWFYAQYARRDDLFSIEAAAREAKRGVWALPVKDRIEPWLWRERKRAAQS